MCTVVASRDGREVQGFTGSGAIESAALGLARKECCEGISHDLGRGDRPDQSLMAMALWFTSMPRPSSAVQRRWRRESSG